MIPASPEPNNLQIADSVRFYLESSLSKGTRNTYRNDLAHFTAWGGSIPASPEQVAAYLTVYASSLSISTLRHRLVAIAKAHKLQGYRMPINAS